MSRIDNPLDSGARFGEAVAAGEKGRAAPAAGGSSADCDASAVNLQPLPRNPLLVSLHDPFSPAVEEYRKLKNALVEMSKEKEIFRNAIAITSAVPGEGKSLTALNLAITLAQEIDHSVLLVDADLRKPALHRYLEIPEGVGLSDVLAGKAAVEQAIVATGMEKLAVMTGGRQLDNAAELVSSVKMQAVIKELKATYVDRFIIFDTPPVLPFAETRYLARLVDGVVFVIKARLASQGEVREAIGALRGGHVVGTVYNAAEGEVRQEHYHYYSRYR